MRMQTLTIFEIRSKIESQIRLCDSVLSQSGEVLGGPCLVVEHATKQRDEAKEVVNATFKVMKDAEAACAADPGSVELGTSLEDVRRRFADAEKLLERSENELAGALQVLDAAKAGIEQAKLDKAHFEALLKPLRGQRFSKLGLSDLSGSKKAHHIVALDKDHMRTYRCGAELGARLGPDANAPSAAAIEFAVGVTKDGWAVYDWYPAA